ncbi:hypothetical protein [Paenibacillus donghaensis]|uniref:Uncharacterized protein n=1 Tax=Paenibacillus donghaensis TaxID=414771 RepID=A0A2Z2KCN3_9BACL|nr:hypothetical protein [Paenibacillus donghaensis]ASA20703.1 hypothetical protein B9T62_07815 [Paenibacillus donghaensis]
MDTLTRFELKKIIRRKSFIAGLVFLVGMTILMAMLLITGQQTTGRDSKFLYGLEAIQLEREYNRQLAGPLTPERVAETIKLHQDIRKDPRYIDETGEISIENYAKYDVKYEQLYSLIRPVYYPPGEFDFYIIDRMNPSDGMHYYQKRMERVDEYLNTEEGFGPYSAEEKAYYAQKNESIPVPFQVEYVSGWQQVFENLPSVFLVTALVIAILLAPMFAGEYQSQADAIILTSRHGHNKLIAAKLKASLIVSLGLLAVALTVYTLLLLIVFGFDGGNASVQIINLQSPVPYTVLQTYGWVVGLGSLACLLVGVVTLWLSSRMSSPFKVIVVAGALVIVPLLLPDMDSNRYVIHLMNLLPLNMFDGFSKVTGYEVLHLANWFIPEYKLMAGYCIIAIAVLLPVTSRTFKNHQIR